MYMVGCLHQHAKKAFRWFAFALREEGEKTCRTTLTHIEVDRCSEDQTSRARQARLRKKDIDILYMYLKVLAMKNMRIYFFGSPGEADASLSILQFDFGSSCN